MTREAWEQSLSTDSLLAHAAWCIPRQHLCLVAASLCEVAARRWRPAEVDVDVDWDVAWSVAALRAWCVFQAEERDLRAARAAVSSALDVTPGARQSARLAVLASLDVALWSTTTIAHPLTWGLDVRPRDFAAAVADVARRTAAAWDTGGPPQFASHAARELELCRLIRAQVLYPRRVNKEWVAHPGIAFSGDVVVRLDGRVIGDVVERSEWETLPAERAVAFDAAQERGEPESRSQTEHRDFIRSMRAYGEAHRARPSPPRPPPPSGPDLEQVDPHGLMLTRLMLRDQLRSKPEAASEGAVRVLATVLFRERGNRPIRAEFLAYLEQTVRVYHGRIVPHGWRPGRWRLAALLAAVSLVPVSWFSFTGHLVHDRGNQAVWMLVAFATAVWLAIDEVRAPSTPDDGPSPLSVFAGVLMFASCLGGATYEASRALVEALLVAIHVPAPEELPRGLAAVRTALPHMPLLVCFWLWVAHEVCGTTWWHREVSHPSQGIPRWLSGLAPKPELPDFNAPAVHSLLRGNIPKGLGAPVPPPAQDEP